MRTFLLLLLVGLILLTVWLVVEASDVDTDSMRVETVAQWGSVQPWYVVEPPTTTTTARARTAPKMRAASAAPAVIPAGSINGYPCGGDLPPCSVMRRESGGNPNAYNARGCNGHGCYGLWQFSGAWACHFGLSCDIAHWTIDEQNHAARTLWDHGRGCSHWAACR